MASLPGSASVTTTTTNSSSSSSTTTTTTTNTTNHRPVAAIAQLRSTANKFQNLLEVATCARLANSKGASMLFLPECFGFIGESSSQTLAEAEDPARLNTATTTTIKGGNNDDELERQLEQLNRALKSIVHGTSTRHDYRNDKDVGSTTTSTTTTSTTTTTSDSSKELVLPVVVHSLMDGLRTIAIESGLWISGGGIHIAGAPPPPACADETDNHHRSSRVYNTHVVLDATGTVVAHYRKIHLFDVSIPGKVELKESNTTAPGEQLVVCDSPVGRLGISTCYDLRFPELYTKLTAVMGAQILLVPSAFTVPTGAAHWHVLLRARAIENQCYVLAAAQHGKHNDKRESFGHSLAVDPWGKVVADAGGYPTTDDAEANLPPQTPPEPPSIVTAEIDLGLIDSIRQRMPIDLHRSNATF